MEEIKNDNYRCEESIRILTAKIKQHQEMIEYYKQRLANNEKIIQGIKKK